MLLPLHSGYDLLQRAWSALHPDVDLCTEDVTLDFPLETCLPYTFPLRSLREECSDRRLPYTYDGMTEWTAPVATKAKAG